MSLQEHHLLITRVYVWCRKSKYFLGKIVSEIFRQTAKKNIEIWEILWNRDFLTNFAGNTHITHTCTHTHIHTHTHKHTHTQAQTYYLSQALSHAVSLKHTHSISFSGTLYLSLSLWHTHTHTHSLSLSLSHTHGPTGVVTDLFFELSLPVRLTPLSG